jgi:hypothetical protein
MHAVKHFLDSAVRHLLDSAVKHILDSAVEIRNENFKKLNM